MNREILFRGKNINDDWHFGNLAITSTKFNGVDAGHYLSNRAGRPFAYHVRPETVGQFTGLNDKNGVKIFEGDVFQGDNSVVYVVVYDGSAFKVQTIKYFLEDDTGRAQDDFPNLNYLDDFQLSSIKVIGNTHDNPELL